MESGKFQIHCDAGSAGSLHTKTNSIAVRIGQRIGMGPEEVWDSIIILCDETTEGLLSARIIVCHPDWDQHLQVACIQSHFLEPAAGRSAFELDLKATSI